MLTIAIAMLFLSSGETQAPPAALQGEVSIQGRSVLLPHVPTSVDQAHAEYGKIGPMLRSSIQDLEKDLTTLYQGAPKEGALPVSFRVRNREAEAARFFSAVVEGGEYGRLEKAVVEAWDEWQGTLIKAGLAQAVQPSTVKEPKDKALLQRVASLQVSAAVREAETREAAEVSTTDADFRFAIRSRNQISNGSLAAQKLQIIANKEAPRLAQSWNPLIQHLNDLATKLLDLDDPAVPYQSQDLVRLKLQAKIRFLERCRSNLWFCQRVWARMTSSPEPPPLRDLG